MHAASHAHQPLRLFIALWPGEALQEAIASWQSHWTWPPHAALVRRERLHLTLHFLGNVPEGRLCDLARGLKVPFEPFSLALGEAQVWPNGVASLRPDHTPDVLWRLHADLGRAVGALDLPVEARPYRAHVTLARRARGAQPPPQGPDLHWRIDAGYALVRTLPGGAGYKVLERFS